MHEHGDRLAQAQDTVPSVNTERLWALALRRWWRGVCLALVCALGQRPAGVRSGAWCSCSSQQRAELTGGTKAAQS